MRKNKFVFLLILFSARGAKHWMGVAASPTCPCFRSSGPWQRSFASIHQARVSWLAWDQLSCFLLFYKIQSLFAVVVSYSLTHLLASKISPVRRTWLQLLVSWREVHAQQEFINHISIEHFKQAKGLRAPSTTRYHPWDKSQPSVDKLENSFSGKGTVVAGFHSLSMERQVSTMEHTSSD